MDNQNCFFFWYFSAGTRKSYCPVAFLHQHPQNFSNEILPKNKNP